MAKNRETAADAFRAAVSGAVVVGYAPTGQHLRLEDQDRRRLHRLVISQSARGLGRLAQPADNAAALRAVISLEVERRTPRAYESPMSRAAQAALVNMHFGSVVANLQQKGMLTAGTANAVLQSDGQFRKRQPVEKSPSGRRSGSEPVPLAHAIGKFVADVAPRAGESFPAEGEQDRVTAGRLLERLRLDTHPEARIAEALIGGSPALRGLHETDLARYGEVHRNLTEFVDEELKRLSPGDQAAEERQGGQVAGRVLRFHESMENEFGNLEHNSATAAVGGPGVDSPIYDPTRDQVPPAPGTPVSPATSGGDRLRPNANRGSIRKAADRFV